MTEVSETQLPGVGVRLEFTAADDSRVGVVVHPKKTVTWDHNKLGGAY